MRGYVPYMRRRALLGAWWWWLLALTPLFATVAFDTWLNTENLRNDYKVAQLNKRLKELKETLDNLKVELAALQSLDRIEIEAPDLGLTEPEPDQIRVIYTPQPITVIDRKNTSDIVPGTEVKQTMTTGIERLVKAYILASPPQAGKPVEETPWDTDSDSNPSSTTLMEDLLQKAISSAYAYCAGDS